MATQVDTLGWRIDDRGADLFFLEEPEDSYGWWICDDMGHLLARNPSDGSLQSPEPPVLGWQLPLNAAVPPIHALLQRK